MITDEAIANAAAALSRGLAVAATMSPRVAAEAAHYAGGPSVDDLERRIRAERAEARRLAS